MVGIFGVMPVWFEKLAPSTSIKSASFMNHEAIDVPERPRTPQAKGWLSGISPLPLKVVSTGAFRRSANAIASSVWKRAP